MKKTYKKHKRLSHRRYLESCLTLRPSSALAKLEMMSKDGHYKNSLTKIKRKLRYIRSNLGARFLRRLVKFFKIVYLVNIDFKLIDRYVDWFENQLLNHGYDRAAKTANTLAGYALRYSVGHIASNVPYMGTLPGGNIPKFLRHYLPYLDGSIGQKNAVHTILSLHRLYGVGNSIPDITGIVKEGVLSKDTFSENPNETSLFVGKYFDRLYKSTKDPKFLNYKKHWKFTLEDNFPSKERNSRVGELIDRATMHISSKEGPNGPCFAGSPLDALALMEYKMSNGDILFDVIEQLATITCNMPLLHYMNKVRELTEYADEPISHNEVYTGRLCIKQEHSGKSRIIAIVDQFTQSCLKCMHEHHFSILRRYAEDGTMDQDNASENARILTTFRADEHTVVGSQDLTEATNALPMDLQIELVGQMYGNEIAKLWYRISSDREFYYQQDQSMIKYAVGNGMGTYTSWSMLALTNHMIARTAMNLNNISNHGKEIFYLIIGDDFCCKGLSLANTYADIFQSIGVSISLMKGYTYRTSKYYLEYGSIEGMPQVVELAKRVYLNGSEITTIRPKDLLLFFGHPSYFVNLVDKIDSRVLHIDCETLVSLAHLTFEPQRAIRCAVSPRKGCRLFRTAFSNMNINDKIADVVYSPTLESYSLDQELLISELNKFGNLTLQNYYDSVGVYLSSLIVKRLRDPIRSLFKVSDNPFWTPYEERPDWFMLSLRETYTFPALQILDCLMLWVIYSILMSIDKTAKKLSSYDSSLEQLEDLLKSCTGTLDMFQLLGRKSVPPVEIQYSRFIRDIDEDLDNMSTKFDPDKILFSSRVGDLINTCKFGPEDKARFNNLTRLNDPPSEYFLGTREGYLLQYSQEGRHFLRISPWGEVIPKWLPSLLDGTKVLTPQIASEVLKLRVEEILDLDQSREVSFIKNLSTVFNIDNFCSMVNPMTPSVYLER